MHLILSTFDVAIATRLFHLRMSELATGAAVWHARYVCAPRMLRRIKADLLGALRCVDPCLVLAGHSVQSCLVLSYFHRDF